MNTTIRVAIARTAELNRDANITAEQFRAQLATNRSVLAATLAARTARTES